MNGTVLKKIKTLRDKIVVSSITIKIVSLVILTTLMLLPFGMNKMNLFNTEETSELLYPFSVLFSGLVQKSFSFFYINCFSFFLLPVVFIIVVISFFQKKCFVYQNILYLCIQK